MNKSLLKKIQNSLDQISIEEKSKLLDNLRFEIDRIDKSISKKLMERTKLVYLIGKLKKKLGISAYSAKREEEIINNIINASDDPFIQKSLKNIYKKIIEESLLIQKLDTNLSHIFGKDKSKGQ